MYGRAVAFLWLLLLVFKIQNTLALDDLCAQLFISGFDVDGKDDENRIVYDK